MVSLRDIRRRIHSVHNIKQITKAMELVAGAQLQKAETKAENSHLFTSKMKNILDNFAYSSNDSDHPLLEQRTPGKIGLMIVGGDRGLCGSYNVNVEIAAEEFLKKNAQHDVELIPVGRRIVEHFRKKRWKIGHEITDWGGKITFNEISDLAKLLSDKFIAKEYDELWVVYTHFISLMSRKLIVEKLLNFEPSPKKENTKTLNYILEPNPEEIYREILPRWLSTKLLNIFDEAYASELAARIFSMKMATKNAEEMIESLTLVRNKIRQANITKEITEIITGAEST